MRHLRRLASFAAVVALFSTHLSGVAHAAPSLSVVQAKIRNLQEAAAAAAEGAQAASVQLAALQRSLSSVKQLAAQQGQTVSALQKSLGAIAIEQYKSGGLGQSMELLFSSDPSLYLSSAGALEQITRRKASQLRKYNVAKQRLTATSLTVNDKLAQVASAQRKFKAQQIAAQAKLKEAQKLLSTLTKAERERLARLNAAQEAADQNSSRAGLATLNLGSGRGAKAVKFALAQLGDYYVFGAAGMKYWDCSGLTMRAFGIAGVSLPHSAAAQFHYGKFIPRNKLMPGDLVFFGSPISHVGIYIGGGRMVHAPRPGSRVKIVSFGSSLGWKRYIGARRL